MKKAIYVSLFILTSLRTFGQTTIYPSTTIATKPPMGVEEQPIVDETEFRDIIAFGLGLGQDYGGIGVNLTIYPQKNIGIFGSVGYVLAGAGFNFGLKLRIIPNHEFKKVSPYAIGMYGYNATVKIMEKSEFDKIFYGPSAGGGIDLRFRRNKGYLSFGITIPFRDPEVDEYMDKLEKEQNADFGSGLAPFTISVGYKIIIS